MKNLAIARRYAKALLLIGKDDGQAELYREELAYFVDLLEENKNLKQAVANPLYAESDRKKILLTVLERLDLSRSITSFLVLLFDKERLPFLTYISECYEKFADEIKGVVRASLVSATVLSSEAVEKIRMALSKRTGKAIVLEVGQDSGLIGGMVTTIGDLVLDGSVRTQLLNMRESLKRGESV